MAIVYSEDFMQSGGGGLIKLKPNGSFCFSNNPLPLKSSLFASSGFIAILKKKKTLVTLI